MSQRFETCKDCPIPAPDMDYETYLHVTSVAASQNDNSPLDEDYRREWRAGSARLFKRHHSSEEQLAVNGCAKIITEGNCPNWHFDAIKNGIFARD